MKQHFTVGEIANAITGGNEEAARKLINDAGITPGLDEYKNDPSELVPRTALIDLFAVRAGDRVGRKVMELLRQ